MVGQVATMVWQGGSSIAIVLQGLYSREVTGAGGPRLVGRGHGHHIAAGRGSNTLGAHRGVVVEGVLLEGVYRGVTRVTSPTIARGITVRTSNTNI